MRTISMIQYAYVGRVITNKMTRQREQEASSLGRVEASKMSSKLYTRNYQKEKSIRWLKHTQPAEQNNTKNH